MLFLYLFISLSLAMTLSCLSSIFLFQFWLPQSLVHHASFLLAIQFWKLKNFQFNQNCIMKSSLTCRHRAYCMYFGHVHSTYAEQQFRQKRFRSLWDSYGVPSSIHRGFSLLLFIVVIFVLPKDILLEIEWKKNIHTKTRYNSAHEASYNNKITNSFFFCLSFSLITHSD